MTDKPVLPAGDVEVLPERMSENLGNSYTVMQAMAHNQCLDKCTIVVTRLTAERDEEAFWRKQAREGWEQATKVIEMQRAKLDEQEAELTKARELLQDIRPHHMRGVGAEWIRRLDDFLAHQSAPAAPTWPKHPPTAGDFAVFNDDNDFDKRDEDAPAAKGDDVYKGHGLLQGIVDLKDIKP